MLRKHDHVPELGAYAVGLAVVVEETGQAGRRDLRLDGVGEHTRAGLLDRAPVDIGGEDLEFDRLGVLIQGFPKDHREGVGLLAGGTARHPGP